ncbi:MAG: insulinase family protein, partial [Gammaproteobacteria bacterium]|nr:insulinase family protein [Gammaproteobacteria bacterium]
KVYEADSLFNQATEIGVLETLGLDWRLSTTEIDSLKAVTPEQVRTVAQRYLVDDNLTVATLVPLPMDRQQPRAASSAGGRHGS